LDYVLLLSIPVFVNRKSGLARAVLPLNLSIRASKKKHYASCISCVPYSNLRLSRTKTDKKDARLIARFCVERRPPLWWPPPPELRALVTRRDALERMRTQEMNRLHAARAKIRQSVERHISYLEREIKGIDAEIRQKTDDGPDLKK
jgi:transposase